MPRQQQREQEREQEGQRQSSRSSHSSRGYPLLIVFTLIVIALIATMLPTAATAAAAATHEETGCDGAMLVRRLAIVNEGGADSATLDAAMAEAVAIWATAGVRLLWVSADPDAARPDAYVVLRAGSPNVMRDAAMMRSGRNPQLGWVRFDRQGQRSRLVEVSLHAVRTSLMYSWYDDGRLAFQPRPVQIQVLGRALGRIIAHEFGHWLIGRGHEREGLMKAILVPHELMRPETPLLPASWTGARVSDRRMALLRASCE